MDILSFERPQFLIKIRFLSFPLGMKAILVYEHPAEHWKSTKIRVIPDMIRVMGSLPQAISYDTCTPKRYII